MSNHSTKKRPSGGHLYPSGTGSSPSPPLSSGGRQNRFFTPEAKKSVSDLDLWPTRTHPGDCFSSHRTGDCSDGLVVVDTSRRYDNASYVAPAGTDSKPLPRKRFWNQLISLADEGVVLVPTSERQQVDHLCSTHWREWTGSVADTSRYVVDIHSHSVATKPTLYCHVSRHELRIGNQRVVAADLRRSNVRRTVAEVSSLSHGRGQPTLATNDEFECLQELMPRRRNDDVRLGPSDLE